MSPEEIKNYRYDNEWLQEIAYQLSLIAAALHIDKIHPDAEGEELAIAQIGAELTEAK